MFLRFGCANFRSFREYQEISFVASSLKDKGADLFEADSGRYRTVPVALVYGANASGKSNLINAIFEMLSLVSRSHRSFEPDQDIRREHFRLDKGSAEKPTSFDIDFVVDRNRYHYGFEYNDEEFLLEWMYEYRDGHRRTLFYREKGEISFGRGLPGQNQSTFDLTRKNSLFFSAAIQNNHKYLSNLYSYIRKISFNRHFSEASAVASFANNEARQKAALRFLGQADIGICDARLSKQEIRPEVREILTALDEIISRQANVAGEDFSIIPDNNEGPPQLSLAHRTEHIGPTFFPLEYESRGTIRALDLVLDAMSVIEEGGFLVVDELDSSLHTLLAEEIIKLFSKKEVNNRGAQLLASTHDTNLLRSEYIRRDQIWFSEKDEFGETNIYPLTRIRTRNTDNLEKGYLQGRFGAIPFSGPISALFEDILGDDGAGS